MPSSRIVVAVDGSEPSLHAVRWTARLASATGAAVTAVHAVSPADWPIMFGAAIRQEDLDRLRESTENALRTEWCAPLRAAGVDVTPVIREGAIPIAILEEAHRVGAGLIVTGTRGHGGFAGLVLGSISRHLVHHAPLPVVVVRGDERLRPPRVVLAGVDGSAESRRALEWAADLCAAVGARLLVVSVWSPASVSGDERRARAGRALDEQAAAVASSGVEAQTFGVVGRAPAGELMDVADEHGADLIVVGHRGASAIVEWALGSVGSELTHHAHQPVVIVRGAPHAALAGAGAGTHYVSEP